MIHASSSELNFLYPQFICDFFVFWKPSFLVRGDYFFTGQALDYIKPDYGSLNLFLWKKIPETFLDRFRPVIHYDNAILKPHLLQDRVDPLKIQALARLGKIQFCLLWTESHKGSNPGKIHFCLPNSSSGLYSKWRHSIL